METIKAMIALYCRTKHDPRDGELCDDCRALQDYAMLRLTRCPYQEEKPTCADCPIHCYKSQQRDQVKDVMRFSGPRMMLRHPIMAIRHILDGRRHANPELPKKKRKTGDA